MSIWKRDVDLTTLNATSANTLVEHLGIIYTQLTEQTLSATMPVTCNTHQPMGLLHGGASVVLAESVGSAAANIAVEEGSFCLGLDINANHVRAVKKGIVTATAEPLHIGKTTQIWQIAVVDEHNRLVCHSRLTMAVRKGKSSNS